MNENKSLILEIAEAIDRRLSMRKTDRGDLTKPNRLTRTLRWLTPNGGTLVLIALLIVTQSVWAKPLLSALNAPGASTTTVNYQGSLADSGGTPLTGTYAMTFAIYDLPADGSVIWGPESHSAVLVNEGLFNVGLGSQTVGGIPTITWNGDRYLEITVGGETLSPRELIRSVPVAGMALTVPDGAITQLQAPSLISSGTSENVHIEFGQAIVTATGTSNSLTLDITFSPGFSSRPTISIIPYSNYSNWIIATVSYSNCDGSSCRVTLRRTSGDWVNGNVQRVDWIAIGEN